MWRISPSSVRSNVPDSPAPEPVVRGCPAEDAAGPGVDASVVISEAQLESWSGHSQTQTAINAHERVREAIAGTKSG